MWPLIIFQFVVASEGPGDFQQSSEAVGEVLTHTECSSK